MDLKKVIHNGESSYMAYKGTSPCCLVTPTYYMLSPGNNSDIQISSYKFNQGTHIIWTMRPGDRTGNYWVGTPGTNDSDDIRIGCPSSWSYCFVDIGSNRGSLWYAIGGSNSNLKMTVEQYNWGANVWDANTGATLASQRFGEIGTFEWGAVYVHAVPNFKLYDCKVTDAIQGTVFDAIVTKDGLYDKVSQSIIPLSGWTVKEESL